MLVLGQVKRGGAAAVGDVVRALGNGKVPEGFVGNEKDDAALFASTAAQLARKLRDDPRVINWLRVAVNMIGSQAEVARKLGVTRAAVNLWLKPGLNGMRDANYRVVERLSEISGIPLNLIGQCGRENEHEEVPEGAPEAHAQKAKHEHAPRKPGRWRRN